MQSKGIFDIIAKLGRLYKAFRSICHFSATWLRSEIKVLSGHIKNRLPAGFFML